MIIAEIEILAHIFASPDPLISILADSALSSFEIILPDPLIIAISVCTSPLAVISPDPLIFKERILLLKSIISISPDPDIETSL